MRERRRAAFVQFSAEDEGIADAVDAAGMLALLEAHPELGSAEMVARVQDVRLRLLS